MERRVLLPTVLFLLALPAVAETVLNERFSVYGDLRSGYYNLHRQDRDNTAETTEEWRARLRAGLKWKASTHFEAAVRFAGRYSTEQDDHGFDLDWHTTTATGMSLGDSTLDEAYLAYREETWSVTLGRFQTKNVVAGVAGKSLDRNDSTNTEITWTDGIRYQTDLANGWQGQFILEHNDREGPANTRRPPLNFTDTAARWSAFAKLENTDALGPLVQRNLSITYLPEALHRMGPTSQTTTDYYTITARTALRWPMARAPGDFMLGLEAGYAPQTPKAQALNLMDSGDSDGLGYHIALNWLDFAPGHNIALIGARTGAGWLISPDFAPNTDLLEVRYQWKIDKNQRLEARLRRRSELEGVTGALDDRVDVDGYLRYTYSF